MNRWNVGAPISEQVAHQIAMAILDRAWAEGEALPPTSQLAKAYLVNPITIGRALEHLEERGWIRAGHGGSMAVALGAQSAIIETARSRFVQEEWPPLLERLNRLGIEPDELQWCPDTA